MTLSQLALRKQQKEQKSLPRALRFVCAYSYCVHTTCHVARSMKLSFFFFFFPEKVSYYPSHQHGFKSGLNMDLNWASLVPQMVKNLPAKQETWV